MRKGVFFPIFVLFLLFVFILFFFAQRGAFSGLTGFFESMTVPLQKFTFGIFHDGTASEEEKLREENRELLTLLAKQKELEKENKALHDQFETINPQSTDLLPAALIGGSDEKIIIDKGSDDGVHIGDSIIYKDNLVGQVIKVSKKQSIVALITRQETAFTAQAVKTESLGVIKGKGSQMLFFENVVLSDTLEKDDLVVTKGDIDEEGKGIPPNLVVGKIVSIHKNPSALFQTAEVKSLIDFSKLSLVFVLKKE